MPDLQWLGTIPAEKSYVAEALERGVGRYFDVKGRNQRSQLELDKIEYKKRKEASDLIVKSIENATPQQRDQILGEDSDASRLIESVYGKDAVDTLRQVGGKNKAAKIAKVNTWIKTKKRPVMGFSVPQNKMEMDTAIALELSDADWRTTYPDIAQTFDAAYRAPVQKKDEGWKWPWQRNVYTNMSEQELFDKAMGGDSRATQEAIRRGYPVGGKR